MADLGQMELGQRAGNNPGVWAWCSAQELSSLIKQMEEINCVHRLCVGFGSFEVVKKKKVLENDETLFPFHLYKKL